MPVLSPKTVARLPLGLPLVDEVFPGFEPGDFAVFHGPASNLMLFELCVRCELPPSRGGLGSSAVFVDGGNVFNPYVVSGIARGYGSCLCWCTGLPVLCLKLLHVYPSVSY